MKVFVYSIIVMSLLGSVILGPSPAQTVSNKIDFDTTLKSWLSSIGFQGDVLEYQKVYSDIGYLDYFRILLEEAPNKNKDNERSRAKIFVEVTDNEAYEFLNFKITEKDIDELPYMNADWIARFAIAYAIKKVSKTLGLDSKTTKVRDGLYKVTINPAPTTEPSRYRFTQIEAFYEVKDLFLSLDVTVKGPKDYLILSYLKSELNGILRALENGNYPGSTSKILISGLSQGSSDYLIRDLLKVPEASREILLELERNPELKVEEWN